MLIDTHRTIVTLPLITTTTSAVRAQGGKSDTNQPDRRHGTAWRCWYQASLNAFSLGMGFLSVDNKILKTHRGTLSGQAYSQPVWMRCAEPWPWCLPQYVLSSVFCSLEAPSDRISKIWKIACQRKVESIVALKFVLGGFLQYSYTLLKR